MLDRINVSYSPKGCKRNPQSYIKICKYSFSRSGVLLSRKAPLIHFYSYSVFFFFPDIPAITIFKSNVRETWRVILVSEADIFLSESLRILAERLSQSEIGLPLRQICYYSPPEEVGVFSTEIKRGESGEKKDTCASSRFFNGHMPC